MFFSSRFSQPEVENAAWSGGYIGWAGLGWAGWV